MLAGLLTVNWEVNAQPMCSCPFFQKCVFCTYAWINFPRLILSASGPSSFPFSTCTLKCLLPGQMRQWKQQKAHFCWLLRALWAIDFLGSNAGSVPHWPERITCGAQHLEVSNMVVLQWNELKNHPGGLSSTRLWGLSHTAESDLIWCRVILKQFSEVRWLLRLSKQGPKHPLF